MDARDALLRRKEKMLLLNYNTSIVPSKKAMYDNLIAHIERVDDNLLAIDFKIM